MKLTGKKVGQNGPPGCKQPSEKGIREAARTLPVPGNTEEAKRHNVRRSLNIANIVPLAKDAARKAGLDKKQSALLAIADEPTPEAQVAKVKEFGQKTRANRACLVREAGMTDARAWAGCNLND